MKVNIQTMTGVHLEELFMKEPIKYDGKCQKVFTTDNCGSCEEERNNHVSVSDDGEECSDLCASKVLLYFEIDVR